MLIDWFTVGAQVLNFIILIGLMKHFLYGPILKAIDGREKRIADQLADAEAKKTEAGKQRDEFQHKNEVFDQARADLFAKAVADAKTEHDRLIDEAHEAADALSQKRAQALKDAAGRLNQALSRSAQKEVFAIARKTLTDLAGASMEKRVVDIFMQRLSELDDASKAMFAEAVKKPSEPAVIRSAFPIEDPQRAAIQNAVNMALSADVALRYETAPELIGGIEFIARGQKLSWSIAGYLASMEHSVTELLQQKQSVATKSIAPDGGRAKADLVNPETVSS
jgi:F-type H+-transporting ATPase subunit b